MVELKLQATCAFRFMHATFPAVCALEKFQTAKVTFKVIQSHYALIYKGRLLDTYRDYNNHPSFLFFLLFLALGSSITWAFKNKK